MNVGTIVEADMLKVRLVRSRGSKAIPRGGRLLGQVEEYFVETMMPGDTFVFAGEILKYEALVEDEVYVSRTNVRRSESARLRGREISALDLSRRARARHHRPSAGMARAAATRCANGSKSRNGARTCRARASFWSRPFRAPTSIISICYPFEGRLAHQTLGMLLTRRLERARLRPLGFCRQRIRARRLGPGRRGARIARGELRAR